MPQPLLVATWGTPRTVTHIDTGEFGVYEGFEYWIGLMGFGTLVQVRLRNGEVIGWDQEGSYALLQPPRS
jgi:hypothetical protein